MCVAVVKEVLAPKRCGDREMVGVDEARKGGARVSVPARAAHDHERPLGLCETRTQLIEGRRLRGRLRDSHARCVRDFGRIDQHVFRQGDDDGTRPTRQRDRIRLRDDLGDPRDVVDLGHPFGDATKHLPVIDFLECAATDQSAIDLADKQQHRRRVFARRMHAVARMRCAGATCDEADARATRELAVRIGHVRCGTFVARRDRTDRRRIVERIQHGEIAFSGHAVDGVGAIELERIDQDAAAIA